MWSDDSDREKPAFVFKITEGFRTSAENNERGKEKEWRERGKARMR